MRADDYIQAGEKYFTAAATVADRYDDVTVLQADLSGFTRLAAERSAEQARLKRLDTA